MQKSTEKEKCVHQLTVVHFCWEQNKIFLQVFKGFAFLTTKKTTINHQKPSAPNTQNPEHVGMQTWLKQHSEFRTEHHI